MEIRPVADLRNKFADISKIVHETEQPIFLTKNGKGDMVVMSLEAYEKMQQEYLLLDKLREAVAEAKSTEKRYDFDDLKVELRERLNEKL